MRVISGILKGKRLLTPKDNAIIRPTTDKVKESMFSIIQFYVKNAVVLDLFSGTGQLGIEALSRGAQFCTFVDRSIYSHRLQLKNLKIAGFCKNSKAILKDSLAYIETTDETYDLIILDPPYKSDLLIKSLESSCKKLKKYGIILCEHEENLEMPKNLGAIALQKQYKYGRIKLTLYRNFC